MRDCLRLLQDAGPCRTHGSILDQHPQRGGLDELAHGVQKARCQTCDGPSTLHIFDGSLYLVIGNGREGMEVWRSETGDDGDWTQISRGGFGDSNNGQPYYNNVTVFNGRLYVGAENSANGAEVWAMTPQIYLPTLLR